MDIDQEGEIIKKHASPNLEEDTEPMGEYGEEEMDEFGAEAGEDEMMEEYGEEE